MESRVLLSTVVPTGWHATPSSFKPQVTPYIPPPTTGIANAPAGVFSPIQLQGAYALNNITFTGGITGDGTGQTIAIVVAYDYPSAQADLTAFDQNYGLPDPPTFSVLNDQGLAAPLP